MKESSLMDPFLRFLINSKSFGQNILGYGRICPKHFIGNGDHPRILAIVSRKKRGVADSNVVHKVDKPLRDHKSISGLQRLRKQPILLAILGINCHKSYVGRALHHQDELGTPASQ
nr:hypothetical protein BHM03_00054446 [Ipomoea trifida]